MSDSQVRVCLISMPFGPIYIPSIGLSLLQAVCRQEGHECFIRYSNLLFAKSIGATDYQAIAGGFPFRIAMAGEWLFSGALSANGWGNKAEYTEWVLAHHGERLGIDTRDRLPHELIEFIDRLHALAPLVDDFLNKEVTALERLNPDIVGLTSVFQQNVASLALAKRLRSRLPRATIVMGGANCEGEMGAQILASFPWIDAIVDGEGEAAFAHLLRQRSLGRAISSHGNLRTRVTSLGADNQVAPIVIAPRAVLERASGDPDYSDFFEQREATFPGIDEVPIHLPFETSRGCWWGAKHHCTFCGLNGGTMQFRSREPRAAVDELSRLIARHGSFPIDAVDNILDNQYMQSFVPELAQRQLGASIFYEVKSNLSRMELEQLKRAGIDRIQPGIESFSTTTLKLMKKGVTGAHNISLLKWCKELGVKVSWNYLWGFPSEPVNEFSRFAELCKWITHLPAPEGAGPIRLDRFSPNFERSLEFGFKNVRPYPSYGYVYSALDGAEVANLAYFFEYDYSDHPRPQHYVAPLLESLVQWISAEESAELVYSMLGEEMLVVDLRPAASRQVVVLDKIHSDVYLAADALGKRDLVLSHLALKQFDAETAQGALSALIEMGYVIELDGRILTMALSLDRYTPQPRSRAAIRSTLKANGIAPASDGAGLSVPRSLLLLSAYPV